MFTRIKLADIPVIVRGWLHNFWRLPIPLDFDFVTERLAVGGGIATARDVEQLKKAGITHVIDMRAEFNDADVWKGAGDGDEFSYLWLPQKDDGSARDPLQYARGIDFCLEALMQPETLHAKVYCHCADGVNRGPTMAYAILRSFGIARASAIAMIRVKRPCVDFYNVPNYVESVEKLFQ